MSLKNDAIFWSKIFWLSAKEFYNHGYTYRASALAFVTTLSLIPLLSIIVYLSTYFVDVGGLLGLVNQYLYTNFLPATGDTIKDYLVKFTWQASHLPIISIIFSFITGILLLLTVEESLNQMWHTEQKKQTWLTHLFCWLILVLLPFFIGTSVFLSEYFSALIVFDFFKHFFIFCFSILTNATIFAILYLAIINTPIKLSEGFGWGIITAILFEITKISFTFYINYMTNYAVIYGAMAAIPIFLLWLYLFWCIFLYGAILMHTKRLLDVQPNSY